MRGRAVRIAVKNLLGNLQGFGRILAHGHVAFGDQRGRAGAAHHLLKEAAPAAGLFDLRGPQRFADLVLGGLPGQDLSEEINCVIEVLPLQGVTAFGKEPAQVTWKFIQAFFCHAQVLPDFQK